MAARKSGGAAWTHREPCPDSISYRARMESTMKPSIPDKMKAAAIDRFGGPEVIHTESLPVPKPRANEVLIRLDAAGIGVWDPYVREGELSLGETQFPYVIGNDGAGVVAAVGSAVERFAVGD